MSDGSSDECFVSADEGSDSEMSFIVKPRDSKNVKKSSVTNPKTNDNWNTWENNPSPSKLSPVNEPPTAPRITSTEKPLPGGEGGESLINIAESLDQLNDAPDNQIIENTSVPLMEGGSWDVEEDSWSNPQENDKVATSILLAALKDNLPSANAWNAEDESWEGVTSQQAENAPKVISTNLEDLGEIDPHEKVYEISKFSDKQSDKVQMTSIPENRAMFEGDNTWNAEDDPWAEFADEPSIDIAKESDAPQNNLLAEVVDSITEPKSTPGLSKGVLLSAPADEEENDWDLEGDPWAESQSKEVEEPNAWDLENDFWTTAETEKVSTTTTLASAEGDWDNVEDLHARLSSLAGPPSNASQDLASAASALVKSVGGGLADLMGGLKLPNLSTFEDSQVQKPPPDGERNERAVSGGSGWNAWGFGSFAKTLTSTVENTGMQLLTGGVDVLEQIGRKTFTALKDNDPGLVYTKRLLRPVDSSGSGQGPQLSQMLREASDHQQLHQHIPDPVSAEARRGDLTFQLESRLALVHMEALELLGSRASARLTTKLARLESSSASQSQADVGIGLVSEGGVLERIWQTLQVKRSDDSAAPEEDLGFEIPNASLTDVVNDLDHIVPGNTLVKICCEVRCRSKEWEPDLHMKEIFYRSIEALAEVTSAILGYLHKLAECLLLIGQQQQQSQHQHDDRFNGGFLDVAEKVASLIVNAKRQNEALCSTYVKHLKQAVENNGGEEGGGGKSDDDPLVAGRRLVASLFLETGIANGYLDDAAANHLVPVLQVACLDALLQHHDPSPSRDAGRAAKYKLR